MDSSDVLEVLLAIIISILVVIMIFGLVNALVEITTTEPLNAQANRDCVQLGYDGGEVAPDMPNALRCWTIILVDEKGQ